MILLKGETAMKRKIISNTYLRDIEKYQMKLYLDEDDYYICVKKLIDVREKFILKNGTNEIMNIDYMKYLRDF